jgi:hypothetical protein
MKRCSPASGWCPGVSRKMDSVSGTRRSNTPSGIYSVVEVAVWRADNERARATCSQQRSLALACCWGYYAVV